MIVSSEPTAPSRLRSGEDRQGILSPAIGWLWKTYPWFIGRQRVQAIRIGTLTMAERDHDCPPLLQTLSGRGSLRSALISGSWCRSSAEMPPHEEGLKLACLALALRAGGGS